MGYQRVVKFSTHLTDCSFAHIERDEMSQKRLY